MRIEPHPLYPGKYVVITDLLEKQLADGIKLILADGRIVDPLEIAPAIDEEEKAEFEAEQAERLDLSDLGRQVAAELAWLDSTIAGIDGYAAAQVRDVVKRLAQENRAILQALRFVVRRLA